MKDVVEAEIKYVGFWCPGQTDAAGTTFTPTDPENFMVQVQLLIGERGSPLSDSFDVAVCSPSYLAENARAKQPWEPTPANVPRRLPTGVLPGNALWFMKRWDDDAFMAAVGVICEEASPGPDWGSVASRIGRHLPWEYDYRYDDWVNEHYGTPFPPPKRDA